MRPAKWTTRIRGQSRGQAFDYHVVSLSRPIRPEELAAFEGEGFALFSINGPSSPDDRKWTYNFRRPAPPAIRRRARGE
jgi:hypothetical protein